jgi:hypothetical protein
MRVLLKSVAVLFVAIAVFLVYAVVNALASAGGARPVVAFGYVVGALVLGFAAVKLWRGPVPQAG